MGNVVTIIVDGKDNASDTFDKVKKSAGGLGSALGDVAKVAGGFVIGKAMSDAPGFFLDAAAAAAEDAASTERLKQTIINAGGSWDTYKNKLDAAIASGQKKGFTDDQVRDSLNFLTNATGDSEEAIKRFAIAQDLSRGANIDMSLATKMVGKLTDENIQTFKKLGITIKDGSTEAEALAAVQKKFAGQADTYADSTAGQMAKAKIQMAELKEQIGYAVLPVMALLAGVLGDKIIPAVSLFVDKVSALGVVVGPVTGFLSDHKEILIPLASTIVGLMIPAVVALITATWNYVAALYAQAAAFVVANAPLILIALLIGLLILAVVELIKHWDWVKEKTVEVWNLIKDFVVGKATEVLDFLKEWGPLILAVLTGPIGIAVYMIATHWNTIKDFVTGAANYVIGFLRDNWQLILAILTGPIGIAVYVIASYWGTIVDGAKAAWNGIVSAAKGGANEVISIINGMINGINGFHIPAIHITMPGGIPNIDTPGWGGFGLGQIPYLANGVRNFAGGFAVVGEHGPELVNLPRGANVFSNRESAGRGGVVVNVGVVNAHSVDEAAQAASNVGYSIQQAMRSRGVAA